MYVGDEIWEETGHSVFDMLRHQGDISLVMSTGEFIKSPVSSKKNLETDFVVEGVGEHGGDSDV